MTATQAPTPGPLSGDDVNRECKACGAFKAERDAACTFCGLAPTAPVEASGSERDGYVTAFYDIAKMLGIGARAWSPAETWRREMRPKLEAALRPQPSGETREAVASGEESQ